MTFPSARQLLPDLIDFVEGLKAQIDTGDITDWRSFDAVAREFYTDERMQAIDDVVMNWEKMASYADQKTLIHVTAVLVALLGLPQYHDLPEDDKNLALWIVLYHDVAKKAQHNKHDLTHGFRSGAICGMGLMEAGLVEGITPYLMDTWYGIVMYAQVYDEARNDQIQDNAALAEIMNGIDQLFNGRNSPAGLIVCGVLFHMSFDCVKEYPNSSPLTDEEIRLYISPRLIPLLTVMTLVDSQAWSLFEPELLESQKLQTLHEMKRVEDLVIT